MKLIFTKDECVPDAETIREYEERNQIEKVENVMSIKIDMGDTLKHYFIGENGSFYLEFFSCGVYEDLYLLDGKEEFISDILLFIQKSKVYGWLVHAEFTIAYRTEEQDDYLEIRKALSN